MSLAYLLGLPMSHPLPFRFERVMEGCAVGGGAGMEQLGLNLALVCRHWGRWVPWEKSYRGDMRQRPQVMMG